MREAWDTWRAAWRAYTSAVGGTPAGEGEVESRSQAATSLNTPSPGRTPLRIHWWGCSPRRLRATRPWAVCRTAALRAAPSISPSQSE